MTLQTGNLRRCIRILESAYEGLQERTADEVLYDIYRAACVKEFELVLEQSGKLHLSARHRALIELLLQKHLPDVEVWAYGSRVSGQSHEGSDLDLVLRGPGLKRIPIGALGDFEEALRESTIPFLVEAHDWAWLPEEFHREIERTHVVLVPGSVESEAVEPAP